jgi:hypothetical protein
MTRAPTLRKRVLGRPISSSCAAVATVELFEAGMRMAAFPLAISDLRVSRFRRSRSRRRVTNL